MFQERMRNSRLVLCALLLVIASNAGCARLPAIAPQQNTATSAPIIASIGTDKPILGGLEAAFTAEFGQPAPRYIYTFTAQTGERVILYLGLLHLTTGQIRTQTIVVQRFNAHEWDAATAHTIYQPFFPPDAQSIEDIASGDGTHHLYKSLLLANTFPPGAFVGTGGKQLAPGTFDVLCNTKLVTNDDSSYGCGLTIGEWPLN